MENEIENKVVFMRSGCSFGKTRSLTQLKLGEQQMQHKQLNSHLAMALGALMMNGYAADRHWNTGRVLPERQRRSKAVNEQLQAQAEAKRLYRNGRRSACAVTAAAHEPIDLYGAKSFLFGPIHANRDLKRTYTAKRNCTYFTFLGSDTPMFIGGPAVKNVQKNEPVYAK